MPTDREEEKIRRLIVDEVAKQLRPTISMLQALNSWKLSLWSNGSGGPPGYLETARAEDKERYTELFSKIRDLSEHKESVDIFIVEQRTVRQLREEAEKNTAELRLKIWKIGWKVVIGVFGAVLAIASWGVKELAPIVKSLWEDYLKAHPMAMERMKNMSVNASDSVYAGRQQSTDLLLVTNRGMARGNHNGSTKNAQDSSENG